MKLKKVLAGVLAASSVLAMAGCESGGTSSGTTNTGNSGTSASANSGSNTGVNSGANSGSTSSGSTSGSGNSDVWFDPNIKGIKVDESKIKPGMKLTVLSNRTDLVEGTGNGYFKDMIKPFEEHYGVTVEFTADSDNNGVRQRITSNLSGCTDVMWMPTMSITKASEYFVPIGTVGELSNYTDITNKAMGDGDSAVVYGVPTGINASGFVYNKKIWDQAGITTAPGTVDDLIADLKKIGESTDATPTLCCYTPAEMWVLEQYINMAPGATGDPYYKVKLLVNGGDIFVEGEPYYEMAKLIFEIFSNDDVHEPGASADWQQTKSLLADDSVSAFMVGSWALTQFKQGGLDAGVSEEELKKITMMAPPYTAPDGKRYASVGADCVWGINNTISDDQKELAKAFVKWWAEKGTYAKDQGFIPVLNTATIDDYPEALKSWADVEFFQNAQTPGAISTTWDDIDKASEVMVEGAANGQNYKNKIAELALAHGSEEDFKKILAECNERWRLAREADENLKAFLETDEAKQFIDDTGRFSKKANF